MTDRELLDALTVLTRRLGLLDPDERLAVEQVPIPEPAPCLAFGRHGQVRLCCTEGRGHAGEHSWQRAMVGKSACIARMPGTLDANLLCQRPTNHAGKHKATGADGVRWAWGDTARGLSDDAHRAIADEMRAKRLATGALGTVHDHETPKPCRSHSPRAGNGAYFTCVLFEGHEGEHRSITALGPKTWRDSEPDPTNSRT